MKKIKIGKNMKEVRIMRGLTQENLGENIVVQLSRQKSKLFIMN